MPQRPRREGARHRLGECSRVGGKGLTGWSRAGGAAWAAAPRRRSIEEARSFFGPTLAARAWFGGAAREMEAHHLQLIRESLRGVLEAAAAERGGLGDLSLLVPPNDVADDPLKILVRARGGRPLAVLLYSNLVSPGLVGLGMEKARLAKGLVGPRLGSVILDPLARGSVGGVTYALLPWCRSFSHSRFLGPIQRRRLIPRVLAWLRSVTRATLTLPEEGSLDACAEALGHIATDPGLSAAPIRAAQVALRRLEEQLWSPRHVLEHNDFWIGNLLKRPSGLIAELLVEDFVVIDWPGARIRGFGFYDLLRFAESVGLRPSLLREEVLAHCSILGTSLPDASAHLLCSLGQLGMNLGHCPRARYVGLVERCVANLLALGDG
jgi:hypothetical protein